MTAPEAPLPRGRALAVCLSVALLVQVGLAAPRNTAHLRLMGEREAVARAWAPLVWLHSDEHFYPSDVQTFISHVAPSAPGTAPPLTVKDGSGSITLPAIPVGSASADTFLLAQFDQECSNCHLPKFLYGKKPTPSYSPPVYAVIHSCHSSAVRASRHVDRSRDSLSGDERLTLRFSEQDLVADAPLRTSTPPHGDPSSIDQLTFPDSSLTISSTQAQAKNVVPTSPVPTQAADSLGVSPHYDNRSESKEMRSDSNYTEANNNLNLHDQESTLLPLTSTTFTVPNTTDQDILMTNERIATPSLSGAVSGLSEGTHSHHLNYTDDDRPIRNRKRDISEEGQVFTVTYWMFYPYNYGKDVCTINLGYYLGRMYKPAVNGTCFGEEVAMGKHVGDWEHVSIQFRGDIPLNMYVSSHHFGAYYKYDSHHHHFTYSGQDTRKGIPMSPIYPERVKVVNSHPVLYSALGSHGLWAAPGLHQYNAFPQLQDLTDEGTEWRTWINLDVVDLKDRTALAQPHRKWLAYEGRWGNPKSKCHTLMAGFCEHNQGPTGIPKKRINFPCIQKP